MPPSRDIDDDAMRVRKLPVPNTHAFTHQKRTSNQRRRRMTSLPPPEQWVLSKMNEMEVAEMIERAHRLSTPWTRTAIVARCTCRCSSCGISCGGTMACCRQWLRSRRRPSSWPTEGCWRRTASIALRGIQFIIQDELRAVIPQRQGLHARARKGGDGVPV